MTEEPGKFRKTLDFLGITESESERRRRGTKAWWINRMLPLVVVVGTIFLLRIFNVF